jgi:hypothetical protein
MNKEKLIAELDAREVEADCWYLYVRDINDSVDECGGMVAFYSEEVEGVFCTLHSEKLNRSILYWDAYWECSNLDELAEHILDYEKTGRELEARITVAPKN